MGAREVCIAVGKPLRPGCELAGFPLCGAACAAWGKRPVTGSWRQTITTVGVIVGIITAMFGFANSRVSEIDAKQESRLASVETEHKDIKEIQEQTRQDIRELRKEWREDMRSFYDMIDKRLSR